MELIFYFAFYPLTNIFEVRKHIDMTTLEINLVVFWFQLTPHPRLDSLTNIFPDFYVTNNIGFNNVNIILEPQEHKFTAPDNKA